MLVLAACGPLVDETGDTSSTTRTDPETGHHPPDTTAVTSSATTTSATTAATTATTTTTSATTSVDESTSTTSTSSAESLDSFSFLDTFEETGSSIECDVWAQDCPDGEKCMPWANDGGNEWNATRCSPIADEPHPPGDVCAVEGSGWTGIDDCAARSMCWGADPKTDAGTCYAQCNGSKAEPQCDDGRECWIGYDGTVTLCVSVCDPLAPTCAAGETCVLIGGGEWVARCIPMQLVEGVDYGSPCEGGGVFQCGEGLVCGDGQHVPGCVELCCTALCDVSMPAACPDAASGQQCWPLFGDMPPMRFANVGACLDK